MRESPTSKVLFLTADAIEGSSGEPHRKPSGHTNSQTSATELAAMVRHVAAMDVPLRELRRRHPADWPAEEVLPRQRVLTVRSASAETFGGRANGSISRQHIGVERENRGCSQVQPHAEAGDT